MKDFYRNTVKLVIEIHKIVTEKNMTIKKLLYQCGIFFDFIADIRPYSKDLFPPRLGRKF